MKHNESYYLKLDISTSIRGLHQQKCLPFARTHAPTRTHHSSIALSVMVWSIPCQTCQKRCFSWQHLSRQNHLLFAENILSGTGKWICLFAKEGSTKTQTQTHKHT